MARRLLCPGLMACRSLLWTSSLAVASVFLQLACGTETVDSGSGGQPGSGGGAATGGQVGSGGAGVGGTASGGAASGGAATGGSASGGAASGGSSATGGHVGSGGGANADCPPTAPEDGTVSCAGRVANCSYEDCDGVGLVFTTCDGDVYQTETAACEEFSCGGETCTAGQICSVNAGGAYLGECIDNPCADGPVTCECANPTCPGDCSAFGSSGEGIQVTCNTCPNGQACP
jgi:hypothetical protein